MQTASSVDMLHGPLTGKLIRFALPIAASSMLQQLFNAADTAVAVAGCAAVTVPLTLFRAQAAGFFSADPAVVQAACLRITLILAFEPLCGLYEVPAGYLRGPGHSTLPAVLMILGICSVRVAWVELVFRRVQTLPCLYGVFPLSWVFTTLLLWGGLLWCKKAAQ